jgi:hypothetical protein
VLMCFFCLGLVILGKWQEAVEFVKVMKADPGDLIQWMKTKATHNVWKLKIAKLEEMVSYPPAPLHPTRALFLVISVPRCLPPPWSPDLKA